MSRHSQLRYQEITHGLQDDVFTHAKGELACITYFSGR